MNILFVCRGNVGRSQIAAALFDKLTKENYEVYSAGTQLSGPSQTLESLKPKTDNVIEVLKEEGINVKGSLRKELEGKMINKMDMIVLTVEDTDPIPNYIKNNNKVIRWNIVDPKGKSLEETRIIKNSIKEKIASLVAELE